MDIKGNPECMNLGFQSWQSPEAGMLKDRKSQKNVDNQNADTGVPEIICTSLLLHSRSRTKKRAKLADRSADAIIVKSTSSRSPADKPHARVQNASLYLKCHSLYLD